MHIFSTDLLISGWPVGLRAPWHRHPCALSITSTDKHTHTHTLSPWPMQPKQLASQRGGSAAWHVGAVTCVVTLNPNTYSHEWGHLKSLNTLDKCRRWKTQRIQATSCKDYLGLVKFKDSKSCQLSLTSFIKPVHHFITSTWTFLFWLLKSFKVNKPEPKSQ